MKNQVRFPLPPGLAIPFIVKVWALPVHAPVDGEKTLADRGWLGRPFRGWRPPSLPQAGQGGEEIAMVAVQRVVGRETGRRAEFPEAALHVPLCRVIGERSMPAIDEIAVDAALEFPEP